MILPPECALSCVCNGFGVGTGGYGGGTADSFNGRSGAGYEAGFGCCPIVPASVNGVKTCRKQDEYHVYTVGISDCKYCIICTQCSITYDKQDIIPFFKNRICGFACIYGFNFYIFAGSTSGTGRQYAAIQ